MIGLDLLHGFLLTLIPPLLLWYQRRRRTVRFLPLSIFPIIERIESGDSPPKSRIPAMSRKIRFLLLLLVFVFLSLAYNGLHYVAREDKPGEWLIVFDNPFSASAGSGNRTSYEAGIEEVLDFTKGLNPRDTYSLLRTAPGPYLVPALGRKDLSRELSTMPPSYPWPTADQVGDLVAGLLSSTLLKGAIVVSPREVALKTLLDERNVSKPVITSREPAPLEGNAGIVAFNLKPSVQGRFDLFFLVESKAMGTRELEALLRTVDGTFLRIPVKLNEEGTGRVTLQNLEMPPGELLLELQVNDLLEEDNTIRFRVAAPRKTIPVEFGEKTRPFIRKALLADRRVHPIPSVGSTRSRPLVRVLDRELPRSGDKMPALVIFPTGDFQGFIFSRIWTMPLPSRFNPLNPITAQLSFRDFRPAKISEYAPPEGFLTLGEAEGVPLIFAGEREGQRLVVWTFDPGDNGLYLDPSLPILALESIQWLAGDPFATWDEGYGCSMEGRGTETGSEPSNILCREITLESGSISIPGLPRAKVKDTLAKIDVRTDLARPCLILALMALLFLAVDYSLTGRTRP